MLSVFEKMKALLGISIYLTNVITWCLTHHHQWTPCGTWDTAAAWDYRMKSLKHSRAVKVFSWYLLTTVFFLYLLFSAFRVWGGLNQLRPVLQPYRSGHWLSLCISQFVRACFVWVCVSQFPRCRDEVLASVNRHGSLRGSDRAKADDSTDKWVSVEVSGCMLRHQKSLETLI